MPDVTGETAADVIAEALDYALTEHGLDDMGFGTTFAAGIVLEALAESDYVVISVPSVAHKGPYDTDASAFLTVADRLDGDYPAGGSNVRAAVSTLLRRVAAAVSGANKTGAGEEKP